MFTHKQICASLLAQNANQKTFRDDMKLRCGSFTYLRYLTSSIVTGLASKKMKKKRVFLGVFRYIELPKNYPWTSCVDLLKRYIKLHSLSLCLQLFREYRVSGHTEYRLSLNVK